MTARKAAPRHGPNIWVVRYKEAAARIARQLARVNKSELIVQGRDGRIRERDSHGSDPFPPRG